jgi:hypothetical protein
VFVCQWCDQRAKETSERLKHLKTVQDAKNQDPEVKMNLRAMANPFAAPRVREPPLLSRPKCLS